MTGKLKLYGRHCHQILGTGSHHMKMSFCSCLTVMQAAVRWVLWDVKDTLVRVRTSVGEQYCQEADRMGLKLSPPEVQAAFKQAYRHYSSTYPNYGVSQGMNGQSWWTGLVRDTFSRCRVQDPVLIDTMAQNLYHNFCSAETWEVSYR